MMDYLEFIINKNLEKQYALLKVAAEQQRSWFHRHPYLTATLATVPAIAIPYILFHTKVLPKVGDPFLDKLLSTQQAISEVLSDIGRQTRHLRMDLEDLLKKFQK
jgi:hypothetical protein